MQRKEERPAEREKARHGDILLPVNSYHCLVPGTYRELALHWHEEMEITLIREGSSNYRIGQSDFLAEEGDILLIPPFCTFWAPRSRICLRPNICVRWRKGSCSCLK